MSNVVKYSAADSEIYIKSTTGREECQGRFSVESAPGNGTTLSFSLPLG